MSTSSLPGAVPAGCAPCKRSGEKGVHHLVTEGQTDTVGAGRQLLTAITLLMPRPLCLRHWARWVSAMRGVGLVPSSVSPVELQGKS